MLSLKHSDRDGGLVLRDPFTGVAVGLEEAELCDGLREWILSAGAGMVVGEPDAIEPDDDFAA